MQRTVIPGQFQTGEPGICDALFLFYLPRAKAPQVSLALWIEFKRPGGKLREGQPEWHQRERLRGATVWVVDDFEFFEDLYQQHFGWLHSSDSGIGQLDLLSGIK